MREEEEVADDEWGEEEWGFDYQIQTSMKTLEDIVQLYMPELLQNVNTLGLDDDLAAFAATDIKSVVPDYLRASPPRSEKTRADEAMLRRVGHRIPEGGLQKASKKPEEPARDWTVPPLTKAEIKKFDTSHTTTGLVKRWLYHNVGVEYVKQNDILALLPQNLKTMMDTQKRIGTKVKGGYTLNTAFRKLVKRFIKINLFEQSPDNKQLIRRTPGAVETSDADTEESVGVELPYEQRVKLQTTATPTGELRGGCLII